MIKHIRVEEIPEELLRLPEVIEEMTLNDFEVWNKIGMVSTFPETIIRWLNSNYYTREAMEFTKIKDELRSEQPWGANKYDRLVFKKLSSTLVGKSYRMLNRTYFKQFLTFLSQDLFIYTRPHDYKHQGSTLWNVIPNRNERDIGATNDIIDIANELDALLKEGKKMKTTDIPVKTFIELGYQLAEIGRIEDAELLLNNIFVILRPYYEQWRGNGVVEFETDISWSSEFQAGVLIPLKVWGESYLSVCTALGKLYKWQGDYEQAVEIMEPIPDLYDPGCVYGLVLGNRVLEVLVEMHHCYKIWDSDYAVETSQYFNAVLECYFAIHNPDKKEVLDSNRYDYQKIRESLLMIVLILDRLFAWFRK